MASIFEETVLASEFTTDNNLINETSMIMPSTKSFDYDNDSSDILKSENDLIEDELDEAIDNFFLELLITANNQSKQHCNINEKSKKVI